MKEKKKKKVKNVKRQYFKTKCVGTKKKTN